MISSYPVTPSEKRAPEARERAITFEWIDLPVGPHPLPEWLLGAAVRWLDGYANSPDLRG